MEEAQEAAANIGTILNAQARGLTVAEAAKASNVNRKTETTDGSHRWIFTNENGDPEGHFLRKFKVIAKRAGLNCGQCETEMAEGKCHERKKVKVSCADQCSWLRAQPSIHRRI
jgi:hypothetical protein